MELLPIFIFYFKRRIVAEEKHTVPAAARPTGKRQATGAQAPVKAKPARSKDTGEMSTRNPLIFLKQVGEELRKVIWPTARQMVTYSIVVILFLIVMVVLVWGVDTLAGLGIQQVLGS